MAGRIIQSFAIKYKCREEGNASDTIGSVATFWDTKRDGPSDEGEGNSVRQFPGNRMTV